MNAMLEPSIDMMPMTLQDLDEILRIEYKVYSHPWSRANFSASMANGYGCWVCRVGGELIGYFVLMMAVDEVHLLNISVAGKHQKRGFGARLLRHARVVARQNGGRILLLEVRPSNTNALTLYRHFGFRQIGVRRGYYPATEGREDALVLTHALEEVTA